MAGLFFDTDVLLYAARPKLGSDEAAKRSVAIGLVGDHDFMTSGQVMAEFYHNAIKAGPQQLTHEDAMEWVDRIALQPCVPVDTAVVQSGASLAKRYKISYWDGAILAAAHHGGADLLYTEDLNHGQRYGDVTAVNPFLPQAH
jgi:predicted nucleic acid-binding protein